MATSGDLSSEDLRFLIDHLERYITALDDERIHSDSHAIQHALTVDIERLQEIKGRLSGS
jgi:hypothetical protein